MSGRISIPICIAAAAALLVSGIGTDLQATTRANDCLTAPNASSPRGQHWYYRIDLPNNRKCWYLHAPLMHRAAKASESHAVSAAADTPVSGSRADSAPRLPHTRILSVKPQPTSLVNAKSIQRGDPTWVPQENVPQGNALQVDGSKLTDAVAASSPAAAKPIQQSDAPWLHKKTFRKKARYKSMDPNRPMPSRRPRPQPQNLSSRVTRLDSARKRSARKRATGRWSGRIEARIGLRMIPTFPRSPLSFAR